jgi:hypothetical protein
MLSLTMPLIMLALMGAVTADGAAGGVSTSKRSSPIIWSR